MKKKSILGNYSELQYGQTYQPEKEVNYTGTHKHSNHKGGLVGALKGLIHSKHFGSKKGARHADAKSKALKKAKGEAIF